MQLIFSAHVGSPVFWWSFTEESFGHFVVKACKQSQNVTIFMTTAHYSASSLLRRISTSVNSKEYILREYSSRWNYVNCNSFILTKQLCLGQYRTWAMKLGVRLTSVRTKALPIHHQAGTQILYAHGLCVSKGGQLTSDPQFKDYNTRYMIKLSWPNSTG